MQNLEHQRLKIILSQGNIFPFWGNLVMQHSEHPTFFSQGHRMVHHCWIRAHHEWKESSSFQSLAVCDLHKRRAVLNLHWTSIDFAKKPKAKTENSHRSKFSTDRRWSPKQFATGRMVWGTWADAGANMLKIQSLEGLALIVAALSLSQHHNFRYLLRPGVLLLRASICSQSY